jgi:hypothetical protein
MTRLFSNNASSTLAATIDDNDLVLQVQSGHGALFPNPGAGEEFTVTLQNSDGDIEIILISSRSSDLLTVPPGGRGQEGTSAQAWTSGQTVVECRLTRDALNSFVQQDDGEVTDALEFSGAIDFSGTTTGVDADELNGEAGSYYRDAGNLNAGTIPVARISAAGVTQHQASLSIATSQLTGNMPDARIVASNVTQHQASITAVAAAATVNGFTMGYRDVPRRTSGFARGECTAVASGPTLNTSDMAEGRCFSIYNDSASSFIITQGSGVTLRMGGTTNTGDRTLAARGMATIWCNSATEAVITGAGVT